jgi:outer membrane protein OmpA-like peptidoglycan-associated protein
MSAGEHLEYHGRGDAWRRIVTIPLRIAVFRETFLFAFVSLAALGAPARPQAPAEQRFAAITFLEDVSVKVLLQATERLPGAFGQASVRVRPGLAEIDLRLKAMKPAIGFGGDFNTYVLWTVSPEGQVFNAGEIVLNGANAQLKATTPLESFGLLISAEPHFLVERPSELIVLGSIAAGLERQRGAFPAPLVYQPLETGLRYERATLADTPAANGWLRVERFEAIVAVRLAERAEAARYAPEEFARAQTTLSQTQQAFAQGIEPRQLALIARRAVRQAVEAKRLAERRAAEAALAAERQEARRQIETLTRAREEAEAAAFRAREEADRARQEAARARASAEELEKKMLAANLEADRLARLKAKAELDARAAREQAAALYARLYGAFAQVAHTQETPRGLVISLPDILFDSGKSTLRPQARETLSRIAGILLVVPEYRISIEGHTDNVGRPQANFKLSQARAEAVRDYLVAAHVSPGLIVTRGFGETRPVASNATAAGRQQNRRVEIVIEGLLK